MSDIARQERKDNLSIQVFETAQQMGAAGARQVAKKIREILGTKSTVNIIFAAAPSQNTFLNRLLKEDIDWQKINAFHMDEYIGLPDNAPQSFGRFLKDRLFNKAPFLTI